MELSEQQITVIYIISSLIRLIVVDCEHSTQLTSSSKLFIETHHLAENLYLIREENWKKFLSGAPDVLK